jgi:hypothetical protein
MAGLVAPTRTKAFILLVTSHRFGGRRSGHPRFWPTGLGILGFQRFLANRSPRTLHHRSFKLRALDRDGRLWSDRIILKTLQKVSLSANEKSPPGQSIYRFALGVGAGFLIVASITLSAEPPLPNHTKWLLFAFWAISAVLFVLAGRAVRHLRSPWSVIIVALGLVGFIFGGFVLGRFLIEAAIG